VVEARLAFDNIVKKCPKRVWRAIHTCGTRTDKDVDFPWRAIAIIAIEVRTYGAQNALAPTVE
jgi:hypothetical protein